MSETVVLVCACLRSASYPRRSKSNTTPHALARIDGWTFVRRSTRGHQPVCPACSNKDGAK